MAQHDAEYRIRGADGAGSGLYSGLGCAKASPRSRIGFDVILLDPPPALGNVVAVVLERRRNALPDPAPPNNIDFTLDFCAL
ncbi:hypothetical protein PE067_06525 [Paracoccus sp. DMF-8]|uniref:hypothetical protein n=1 Tax=Paracoccus sp. DMF-8 TaxID=3019445 RepID=UPI0023E7B2DB|nr:hypothetical protein [Paracoccus sp. DMF-8]MDF3605831.1 hypothetical protein [Paracoccus sp. DMF-8]